MKQKVMLSLDAEDVKMMDELSKLDKRNRSSLVAKSVQFYKEHLGAKK